MRILYLLFILSLIHSRAIAQQRFDNWQWAEWEQVSKYLENGDFNSAISICKLHLHNGGFAERLKQIQNLKQLYSKGEQQQKSGNLLEAIAIFKKHRSYTGIGSLMVFEKKIDECVAKLGTPNLTRLKTLERQVFAAELLFRAQRKLDQQDGSGALKDFAQAKVVIGSISGNIKVQIERGLRATNEFIIWERQYKIAKSNLISKVQERDLLVELGYIPIVKIPALNRRLATLIEEIDGKNSLEEAVRNCELERMVENLFAIHSSKSSEVIAKRNYFSSIYNKIEILRSDRRNDSTVFSAYRSLSDLVEVFPAELQPGLKRCINDKKLSALKAFKEQALAEGDRVAAVSYNIALAREGNVDETMLVQCMGIEVFNTSLAKLKDILTKCEAKAAQKLWNELQVAADCEEKKLLLKANADLSKEITEMIMIDRRYNNLLNSAKINVKEGRYKDAKVKYKQLSEMAVCDIPKRDAEVKFGLIELSSLEGRHGVEISVVGGVGANKPTYKINSVNRSMDYGISFGGGFQFAYVNPSSPADLVFGIEYLSTSYYSVDNDNYAIEKFTVDGLSGLVAIKLSPFKKLKVRPYVKLGFEGIVPLSQQYDKYSSLGAVGSSDQLKRFLPSVMGALGIEFKVAKTYLFLEAMGNTSIQTVFDKNSNVSLPGNNKVDARFQRAMVRIGIKLF